MKTHTIAVQDGLEPIKSLLKEKGYLIVPYQDVGHAADIVVISGIDSAYEEMETAQCMIKAADGSEMLVINATSLTPEEVLHHVENNLCV